MPRLAVNLAALIIAYSGLSLPSHAQQDKSKRPSPPATATCKFSDGKTVTVDYSSPRMKGRKIFGGLVPYGKVWRAGANEATTFVTTANLMVGDKKVPAGSYTLFVVPNENEWTLIISKKTGEWGEPYPGEADDFARVDMHVMKLSEPVENFTITCGSSTISLGGGTGTAYGISMNWETTSASVGISEQN